MPLSFVGSPQQRQRVQRREPGSLTELQPAAAAVGNNIIRLILFDPLEHRLSDRHRDIMLGDFKAVGAGLPATTGIGVFDLKSGNHRQQFQAGFTDSLRP